MYLIKRITLVQLTKNRLLSEHRFTHILLQSISLPSNLIILLINLVLFEYLLQHYQLIEKGLGNVLNLGLKLGLILTVLLFTERFVSRTLSSYAETSESIKTSKSIMKGLSKVIIIGIGCLVILSTLGISITPIVASLGITSLAVALALQPTLENFFSGVQLVMDKPIRVGDYIELDSGEQGFVEKIGWRSTWIKMLPNNIVVMPNSKLSQSKIINYYYPEKELSVPVDVGVHYNSDLEHVEKVTLEVAKEILKSHKWGVDDYDTFVVFHTFDSSSINFTVMLRAEEYFNRFFIKSAFIKALHKRYAEEGITIPYPIRAINTQQESPKPSSLKLNE
jgi:small-conductance mechanosensitive channel